MGENFFSKIIGAPWKEGTVRLEINKTGFKTLVQNSYTLFLKESRNEPKEFILSVKNC